MKLLYVITAVLVAAVAADYDRTDLAEEGYPEWYHNRLRFRRETDAEKWQKQVDAENNKEQGYQYKVAARGSDPTRMKVEAGKKWSVSDNVDVYVKGNYGKNFDTGRESYGGSTGIEIGW